MIVLMEYFRVAFFISPTRFFMLYIFPKIVIDLWSNCLMVERHEFIYTSFSKVEITFVVIIYLKLHTI